MLKKSGVFLLLCASLVGCDSDNDKEPYTEVSFSQKIANDHGVSIIASQTLCHASLTHCLVNNDGHAVIKVEQQAIGSTGGLFSLTHSPSTVVWDVSQAKIRFSVELQFSEPVEAEGDESIFSSVVFSDQLPYAYGEYGDLKPEQRVVLNSGVKITNTVFNKGFQWFKVDAEVELSPENMSKQELLALVQDSALSFNFMLEDGTVNFTNKEPRNFKVTAHPSFLAGAEVEELINKTWQ